MQTVIKQRLGHGSKGREHDAKERESKKGYNNEEENVSKDRGKGSSLQCIKYYLTEARIANCYYPGDNKTVTIFADSERGDHKR